MGWRVGEHIQSITPTESSRWGLEPLLPQTLGEREAAGFRRNTVGLHFGRFGLMSWIYSELLCNT